MADRLGLKRAWFQNRTDLPHYDLTEGKRHQAVRMGAIEVGGGGNGGEPDRSRPGRGDGDAVSGAARMTLPITGEYPSNWKAIARLVKDEAGWRCVRCRHGHDPKMGRTLTVHHFDGDKGNCERWNLMALCQVCHLSVQGRVNPAQGLMGEPSPWAIPYIIGMVEAGRTPEPVGYSRERWEMVYRAMVGELPGWADSALTVGGGARRQGVAGGGTPHA